jgi:glycerol-3-phosphate dehydrogenase (NAD(P)+)
MSSYLAPALPLRHRGIYLILAKIKFYSSLKRRRLYGKINLMAVVIIGAGEIGRAIGKILHKKKIKPVFWDKDPSKVPNQKPLAEIIPGADFLFLAVPSWGIREAIINILPYLKKKTIVISLAKGIEAKTRKTTDELLKTVLPANQKFALLSGPMIAEELTKGRAGAAVIAAEQKAACKKIAGLFKKTNLGIEYSNDLRGVALAGALKNIYAVLFGMADGLRWGDNQKGRLASTAVGEMAEIIKTLAGKKETAYGTAGLADLIATGYSPYSRNRQAGEKLVKTDKRCLKSEGFSSLAPLINLLRKRKEQFPLLLALEQVVVKNRNPKKIIMTMRARQPKTLRPRSECFRSNLHYQDK